MAEFTSKGVGSAGLTLGIIGTALAALGQNGNGLLGNLLGSGNNEMMKLVAENTLLKSQQYTDNVKMDVAKQSEQLVALKNEIALREQITDGKINQVATVSAMGIQALQSAVGQITQLFVPAQNVTPLPAPNPYPPVPPYSPYPPYTPPATDATKTTSGNTGS